MKLTAFLRNSLGSYPSASAWPEVLYPPSERGFFGLNTTSIFWDKLKELREFTDKGSTEFSPEYNGSTGWEYGLGMVLFWDNLHFSEVFTSKNYTAVSSRISVTIKTIQNETNLIDELSINDRKVDSKNFEKVEFANRADLIANNKYPLQIAGIVHTHPKIKSSAINKIYYSFFSTTDINSWVNSGLPTTLLITDRVWMLGMTKEFKQHHINDLQAITRGLNAVSRAELKDLDALYAEASRWAASLELALYVAEFGGSFYKI